MWPLCVDAGQRSKAMAQVERLEKEREDLKGKMEARTRELGKVQKNIDTIEDKVSPQLTSEEEKRGGCLSCPSLSCLAGVRRLLRLYGPQVHPRVRGARGASVHQRVVVLVFAS